VNETNAKERFEAALRLEEPDDRVPVTVFGSVSPYNLAGVSFEEAMFRTDLVVKVTEKWQEIFPENDLIMPMAPGLMVAGWVAMGAEFAILSTGWFDVTKPGVKNMAEFEELDFNEIVERFTKNKMFTTGVEAVEIMNKKYGKDFLIATGWEVGFTMAGRIIGTEQEMLLLIDEPKFVHKLADFCNKLWIEGAEKIIDAGANMAFTPDPNSMTMLISPNTYREFAWPLQKEMAEVVKKLGCYHHLHICGNAEPILDEIAETGTDMYSFDQRTRITEAKRKIGNKIALLGNVDPARMLLGKPQEVMELSKECIRIAGPGGGYVLGPGCDTAKMTPAANYRAMCDAAVKYGKYPISL
jgi:uroporphyrinogen decarboxylase